MANDAPLPNWWYPWWYGGELASLVSGALVYIALKSEQTPITGDMVGHAGVVGLGAAFATTLLFGIVYVIVQIVSPAVRWARTPPLSKRLREVANFVIFGVLVAAICVLVVLAAWWTTRQT